MKILGRIVLSAQQAATLAEGADIALSSIQLRTTVRGRARVGDMLWVQEPFLVVTSAETVVAYRRTLMTLGAPFPTPAVLRQQLTDAGWRRPYMTRQVKAAALTRENSRATLEITGFDAAARTIACKVHMQQADRLAKGPRGDARCA